MKFRVKHVKKSNGQENFYVQEKTLFFWYNLLDFDTLDEAKRYMNFCVEAEKEIQSQETWRNTIVYYYPDGCDT